MAGQASGFLGKGWAFPPEFTPGGSDVRRVADEDSIAQSLRVLLSTAPGERILLEDYGCDLRRFMFEEIDRSLRNNLVKLLQDAILHYEPRIELEKAEASTADGEAGVLLLELTYRVLSTNSRYNMVYPFYLNEASTPV